MWHETCGETGQTYHDLNLSGFPDKVQSKRPITDNLTGPTCDRTPSSTMKRSKRIRGHTLIEVLIASFLALACALIFAATMPTANTSRVKADLNNRALSLAQKEMEAIRTLGFANTTPAQLAANGLIDSATPVATNTYSFTNIDTPAVDSPATVLPNGQGRVRIETAANDLRRVTIIVTWQERGRARTVTIATLVANL